MTEDKTSCLERRYGIWVEQLRHESAVLWRTNQAFLLPLVALMAFVLSTLFGEREIGPLGVEGISPESILSITLVGFGLSIIWLMSCFRSLEIFEVRKESVEKLEKALEIELKEERKS